MDFVQPNQCFACSRFRNVATCDAFPDGIPAEIFDDGADHRTPIDGDNGKQFKLLPSQQGAFDRWIEFDALRRDRSWIESISHNIGPGST